MRMCYTHHGPYKAVEGKEGCQDQGCLKLRQKKLKPYYAKDPAVPGGAHEKASPEKVSSKKVSSKKSSSDTSSSDTSSSAKSSTEKTSTS